MSKLSLSLLKVVGYTEGLSFLVLLLIAMPLKYFTDFYNLVPIIGMLHGVLFVAFVAVVIFAAIVNRWSFWLISGALLSSLIPFGPFILESRLRKNPRYNAQ